MAVTASKQKSKNRLDFGAALNEALFNDDNTAYTEFNQQSEEHNVSEENHIKEIDINDDANTKEYTEQNNDIQEDNNEQKINKVNTQVGEQTTTIEEHRDFHTADNSQIDDDDDAEMFLALAKGGRGVQRSVYFENDVYQYLQAKSEKYNVKFSNVVNLLLKESIFKK